MPGINRFNVLTVERDSEWQGIVGRVLEDMPEVNHVAAVNGANQAIHRLEAGKLECVVTAGLHGEWERIADCARSVGAGLVLLSSDSDATTRAWSSGMGTVLKQSFSSDHFAEVLMGQIFGAVGRREGNGSI